MNAMCARRVYSSKTGDRLIMSTKSIKSLFKVRRQREHRDRSSAGSSVDRRGRTKMKNKTKAGIGRKGQGRKVEQAKTHRDENNPDADYASFGEKMRGLQPGTAHALLPPSCPALATGSRPLSTVLANKTRATRRGYLEPTSSGT